MTRFILSSAGRQSPLAPTITMGSVWRFRNSLHSISGKRPFSFHGPDQLPGPRGTRRRDRRGRRRDLPVPVGRHSSGRSLLYQNESRQPRCARRTGRLGRKSHGFPRSYRFDERPGRCRQWGPFLPSSIRPDGRLVRCRVKGRLVTARAERNRTYPPVCGGVRGGSGRWK